VLAWKVSTLPILVHAFHCTMQVIVAKKWRALAKETMTGSFLHIAMRYL
jgi:hypothetical protein